jgi:tetratricopeptide (TPR) repeat protein
MRFHNRTRDDKLTTGKRSLAEAERGQVHLALERLLDLADEFPDDPEVLYVEALVRWDHLGQGSGAQELFERVYHLIPADDRRLAETRAFAACNAAVLSRNESELHRWLALARQAGPNDPDLRQFANGITTSLGQGLGYRVILWNAATEYQGHGAFGKEAGVLELFLGIESPPLDPTKEVQARRHRAEALRELDRNAMTQRNASLNVPMPDERMTLQEGLRELEQALELDPYDAELWNFRSAWCILLKRYEEAIPHAERVLSLRPQGYVKPLINKATALGYLGRYDESAAVAQEAIDRATDADDRSLARTVLADFRQPPAPLTPPAVRDLSQAAWDEARNIANNELGAQGGGASRLAAGILKRVRGAGADAGMLAELLNDFFPETVFVTISEADRARPGLRRTFADAARHLVGHANEIVRRDAARFLALAILRAGNAAAIRSEYRRMFPEPANLTMGATETIDPAMHRVLQSFHSRLPAFLTSREPIDDEWSRAGCATASSALALIAVIVLIGLFF